MQPGLKQDPKVVGLVMERVKVTRFSKENKKDVEN